MDITTVHLVYFSPTGSTHAVLKSIAEGMNGLPVREHNLTRVASRSETLSFGADDLVLLGAPVYYGRIPAPLHGYTRLKGGGAPVVPIVVYGNRDYEDALRELTDVAAADGFVPVAAGAFVAEHSLNAALAAGRPDAKDRESLRVFGEAVMRKLAAAASAEALPQPEIPGNVPYKAYGGMPFVPDVEPDVCISCGMCAEACPVAIIEDERFTVTHPEACLCCMACVRICPVDARGFTAVENEQLRTRMEALARACAARREPEIFI